MTILELLVVVSILGILATLGSVQVLGYLDRARADTARLQIRQLAVAVDVFAMDVGRPPTDAEGLDALLERPADAGGWRGPYLRGRDILKDPWRRGWIYSGAGEDGDYEIRTLGADGRPGGTGEDADIANGDTE